jgi:sialate O-acetylesterase
MWLRKTFSLSAAEAGKSAELHLAMIDDSDETYVNGVKVGGLTAQYNTPRIYAIKEGLLKAGKNVIAVRVTDTGGGGGIYGQPENVKFTIGDRTELLTGTWKLRVENMASSGAIGPNDFPTLLFNAMLNPLIPYTIQGAIWYQGESNAGRAFQYRKAFPLMITDWRKHWALGDFPFYFVQLASFNAGNGNGNAGSAWAELREAQAKTLSLPRTGMAVTTDIGEANDIHPRNKQDVGYRLAAVALKDAYGMNLVSRGPTFDLLTVRNAEAVITFKNTGSGLMTPDKYGYLRGFEIAGSDQKFFPARAFIKDGQVVVSSDAVANPVAVRYNWMDDALESNLFNREGFPAEPFRTDEWKGVTEGAKFSTQ